MQIAEKIYIYLRKIKKKVKKNIKFFNRSLFKKELIKLGASKIDYLNIINLKKLKKAKNKKEKFNIFIAYYLNHIRLIDNF